MERLTKRNLHDFAIPIRGTDAVSMLQTIDRLAAYEDTRREPEEMLELKGRKEELEK